MSLKFQKPQGSIPHPKICKKSPPVDRTEPPLSGAGVTFPGSLTLALIVDIDSDLKPPGLVLATTFLINQTTEDPELEHAETVTLTLSATEETPSIFTGSADAGEFFGILSVKLTIQDNEFFFNYEVTKTNEPGAGIKFQNNITTPPNWDLGVDPFSLTQGTDAFSVGVDQIQNIA